MEEPLWCPISCRALSPYGGRSAIWFRPAGPSQTIKAHILPECFFKGAKEEARQKEEAAKKAEKRRKKAEKNGENIDSIEAAEAAKLTFLNINARSGNTQEVYAPLLFETDQPVYYSDLGQSV